MKAIRDAFGEALVEVAAVNANVMAVSCDLRGATRLQKFFDAFPDRSIEVGISEANGIGIAAGLALSGYRPFIASFGAFITGKNVEIRTSVGYNNAPVVVVGTHGGLIGPDGATQAGLQDLGVMRSIPNFSVFQPASEIETHEVVRCAAELETPVYIRIARNAVPEIYGSDYRFKPGVGHVLRDGSDITLVSSGPCVHACLAAADQISDYSVRVVNMPSIKPFDESLIAQCVKDTKLILTLEDHCVETGLGALVAQSVAKLGSSISVLSHGVTDRFAESGIPSELEREYGIDADGVEKFILSSAQKKLK